MADLRRFHAELKKLDSGEGEEEKAAAPAAPPAPREVFRKNEVVCLECGKGGFKTLTRHLSTAHRMKPGEYRKKHGIPAKQPLAAKSYSEARRKMAQESGLAANLAKAREVRMTNLEARKEAAPKTGKGRRAAKAARPKATGKGSGAAGVAA